VSAPLAGPGRDLVSDEELRKVRVGRLTPHNAPITLVEYDAAWPGLFARESARIRALLAGRALYVGHVGSTSVPGLTAKPIIDMLLVVPDSADEPSYLPVLEAAGYVLRIREPGWFEHRLFTGPDTDVNLHVFSRGASEIDRMRRFRDRLRASPDDRDYYARTKRELARRSWRHVQHYAAAKTTVVAEIMDRANPAAAVEPNDLSRYGAAVPFDDDVPWRAWTPREVTDRLATACSPAGGPVRWAVAGGWAIDLFLGQVTREHEDLEIVVLNEDVPAVLAAFEEPTWRWDVPTPGWLHPLASPAFADTHQTWLWSAQEQAFVLDVFRADHDGETWICRRDETVRRPWHQVVATTPDGTPYQAPEIVLLFKARHARAKDVADLHSTLPALTDEQRNWLRTTLHQVHPGHAWLDALSHGGT
jgi:GrpB-like predicted nucleotidyltransferase (UPF0157 family)